MSSEPHILTQEEIENIVRKTVKETLTTLGVDVRDPLETQKDFGSLRNWRKSVESVQRKSILTAVGIIVTGLLAALVVGLKHALK